MSKKRSNRISTFGAQLSTVISVSLVLLILGVILIITSLTSGAGNSVRRNMSMVVSVMPDTPQESIDSLGAVLWRAPYVAEVAYVSADEVMKQEMEYNADIINALGHNPFTAEFDIRLKPQYVETDSIAIVMADLQSMPIVDDVYSQSEAIDSLNDILRRVTTVLVILGLIILVVSVILLFNTISLSIYSRRFIIHTMQLVGATSAFIRRPFVLSGALIGLVSSIIASAMVCLLHYYLGTLGIDEMLGTGWGHIAVVCAILVVMGMTGCALAAACASSRYLRSTYDSLYTH